MFAWITSWWRSEQGPVIAPARNAPNDGRDIKTFLTEEIARRQARNNTSTETTSSNNNNSKSTIIIVTTSDIQLIRQRLRKVPDTYERAKPHVPPLHREMNDIFSDGREAAFRKLREKRDARKRLTDQSNVNVTEEHPNKDIAQEVKEFARL